MLKHPREQTVMLFKTVVWMKLAGFKDSDMNRVTSTPGEVTL